jgi:L-iditol 2-dehydrogenase
MKSFSNLAINKEYPMLAAVYHGPNDLRVEQIPVPVIKADEVLLKMVSASICGTDLRILHGNHRLYPPGTVRIPGHELVGDIAGIGVDITGISIGQRFFIAPNIACGYCRQCISGLNNRCENYTAFGINIDGAFSEYVRIPAACVRQGNLIPISLDFDPNVASLAEPLSCVLHGQRPLNIRPGDRVLVMGAGPIGIIHMLLAKLQGADQVWVSDMIPDRIAQARELGADRVIDLNSEDQEEIMRSETNGQGADVVIVAAPAHKAQEAALQIAGIGGRINFFGGLPKNQPFINFDSNLVHYKELLVTATTACSTRDCVEASGIIKAKRIDLSPLVSAKYPLKDSLEAFAAAENRKSLKVVITN